MENGKKIKLFMFIHDLAPFGAQRVALNIVSRLNRDRFETMLCVFGGDMTLAPEFAKHGAEIVHLGARRYLDPRAWKRFIRLLFGFRPDIIHTTLPELSVPVRLLALPLPRSRVMYAIQNPFSSEPWYWLALNYLTMPLCRRIVFCSNTLKQDSGLICALMPDRAKVAQNGIEAEPVPAGPGLRDELGIGADEKVVVCVARLAYQKGQDILVRAFARIASLNGGRMRLLLVGDGEDSESLKELAAASGDAGKKIIFLGRRPDVSRILAASDIYAAPSRWEGMGLSLGEAMLTGIPCAGTAIPGHADILHDGVTGIAVPVDDAAALAAGIARLLDDPAEAARMAKAAAEQIKTGFTVSGMTEKYEKIYLEMAGR